MERLIERTTGPVSKEIWCIPKGISPERSCCDICEGQDRRNGCYDCPIQKIFNLLAEYEDLGKTPQELKKILEIQQEAFHPHDFNSIRLPTDDEWEMFMDAVNEDNSISYWRNMYSWTLSKGSAASTRAVRGYYSARYWGNYHATGQSVLEGFRPAFVPLSPVNLYDGQSVVVGTLFMNGEPIPVPQRPTHKGDIPDYIPGAKLEFREAKKNPKFQVTAIKTGNILVCDRNLLKNISWTDLEDQGFCRL